MHFYGIISLYLDLILYDTHLQYFSFFFFFRFDKYDTLLRYFRFLVIFVLMSCFGGCGYWRRRQWMLANQQRTTSQPSYPSRSQSAQYRTAVFGYAAPFGMQQSTPAQPQGAFPSPPPYSEVSTYTIKSRKFMTLFINYDFFGRWWPHLFSEQTNF